MIETIGHLYTDPDGIAVAIPTVEEKLKEVIGEVNWLLKMWEKLEAAIDLDNSPEDRIRMLESVVTTLDKNLFTKRFEPIDGSYKHIPGAEEESQKLMKQSVSKQYEAFGNLKQLHEDEIANYKAELKRKIEGMHNKYEPDDKEAWLYRQALDDCLKLLEEDDS